MFFIANNINNKIMIKTIIYIITYIILLSMPLFRTYKNARFEIF